MLTRYVKIVQEVQNNRLQLYCIPLLPALLSICPDKIVGTLMDISFYFFKIHEYLHN